MRPLIMKLLAGSLLVVLAALRSDNARADYIILKNGGELHGELQRDTGSTSTADRVTIRTLSGTLVTVAKTEIQTVTRRRLAVEQYEQRAPLVAETVEAQWQLAEWCREKSLTEQRTTHLERVVELDPNHAAARRALGHVQYEGEWVSRDEMMAARGYVKYKGRYLLPQELELILQEQLDSEAEKGWFQKINMWHTWLTNERLGRQAEGLQNLQAIDDPLAVPALYRVFHDSANEQFRLLYVSILSRIEGNKPLGPLVTQSLQDVSADVRLAAVRGVQQKDRTQAIPVYLKGLKHDLNVIVNRSALALGEMGDDQVVPQLIDSLITKHKYRVSSNSSAGTTSFSTNGAMVPQNAQPPLPPDIAAMLATGQLPYGVQVNQVLPPGMGLMKSKKTTIVEKDEENPSVLDALQRLTGQNFAFEEQLWRNWYNGLKNAGGTSKKKTRQP